MLSDAESHSHMLILPFKEEIFILCYNEARSQNSNRPPSYTQLQKVFEMRGFSISRDSLKTCYKKINVKRKKQKHALLKLHIFSLPDKFYISAYKKTKSILRKRNILRPPKASEIARYLGEKNIDTFAKKIRERIKKIRRKNRNKKLFPLSSFESIDIYVLKRVYKKLCKIKALPSLTQVTQEYNAFTGETVRRESMSLVIARYNKRTKNRRKRLLLLKRHLSSGIYDQDILGAHASFVMEYGKNPVIKELRAYLLKDRPNRFITCMSLSNRIKNLRRPRHKLPLRGKEKISSDIVKDVFCELRREKGKNPLLKELRAELLARYPHISITTDALSRRLASIRKKVRHSQRHLFVPRGKNISIPFTAIHKAYDKLLRDRRNNKMFSPLSKAELIRKLAPRFAEKRVGVWQKHVNYVRAQEGKYPILFSGELAYYDLLVLRSYKALMVQEINGITAMSALKEKLGIRYTPCSLQRIKKESCRARLPELPVPSGYIKIEELRQKNVVPLINLYVLWTISRAVLDMKTLIEAGNHAHQKEKTLHERFTPKNRNDDNQFSGKMYVLSLAMLSGYLTHESFQGLIHWLENECPDINSAVFAIDEKISSIVKRAESLK